MQSIRKVTQYNIPATFTLPRAIYDRQETFIVSDAFEADDVGFGTIIKNYKVKRGCHSIAIFEGG